MKNDALIDAILCFLKEYKNEAAKSKPNKEDLEELHYLIGQTIRQYDIPVKNFHLSQGAQDLWNKLSTKNILDYHYKEIVVCDKLSKTITCKSYKGASKTGESLSLSKNSKFIFRQIFHEDHIVPVSLIWEAMRDNPMDKQSLKKLLDKMHICYLLKEEDRRIPTTKGRSLDFLETIDNIYTPAGIRLVK